MADSNRLRPDPPENQPADAEPWFIRQARQGPLPAAAEGPSARQPGDLQRGQSALPRVERRAGDPARAAGDPLPRFSGRADDDPLKMPPMPVAQIGFPPRRRAPNPWLLGAILGAIILILGGGAAWLIREWSASEPLPAALVPAPVPQAPPPTTRHPAGLTVAARAPAVTRAVQPSRATAHEPVPAAKVAAPAATAPRASPRHDAAPAGQSSPSKPVTRAAAPIAAKPAAKAPARVAKSAISTPQKAAAKKPKMRSTKVRKRAKASPEAPVVAAAPIPELPVDRCAGMASGARQVCANPELSALDRQISEVGARLRAGSDARTLQRLANREARLIRQRDRCADPKCLSRVYRDGLHDVAKLERQAPGR